MDSVQRPPLFVLVEGHVVATYNRTAPPAPECGRPVGPDVYFDRENRTVFVPASEKFLLSRVMVWERLTADDPGSSCGPFAYLYPERDDQLEWTYQGSGDDATFGSSFRRFENDIVVADERIPPGSNETEAGGTWAHGVEDDGIRYTADVTITNAGIGWRTVPYTEPADAVGVWTLWRTERPT